MRIGRIAASAAILPQTGPDGNRTVLSANAAGRLPQVPVGPDQAERVVLLADVLGGRDCPSRLFPGLDPCIGLRSGGLWMVFWMVHTVSPFSFGRLSPGSFSLPGGFKSALLDFYASVSYTKEV